MKIKKTDDTKQSKASYERKTLSNEQVRELVLPLLTKEVVKVEKKNNTYYFDGVSLSNSNARIRDVIERNFEKRARSHAVTSVLTEFASEKLKSQVTEKPDTLGKFDEIVKVFHDLGFSVRIDHTFGMAKYYHNSHKNSISQERVVSKIRKEFDERGLSMPDEMLIVESLKDYLGDNEQTFIDDLYSEIAYKPDKDIRNKFEAFARHFSGTKFLPIYTDIWMVFFHNLKKGIFELEQEPSFMLSVYGKQSSGKSNAFKRIFIKSKILHYSMIERITKLRQLFDDERRHYVFGRNLLISDEAAGMGQEDVTMLKQILDQDTVYYRKMRENESAVCQRKAVIITASNVRLAEILKTDDTVGFRKFVEIEVQDGRSMDELIEWGNKLSDFDYTELLRGLDENADTLFKANSDLYEYYLKFTTICCLYSSPTVKWFQQYISNNGGAKVTLEDVYTEYCEKSHIIQKYLQSENSIQKKMEGFFFKYIGDGEWIVPNIDDCWFFASIDTYRESLNSKDKLNVNDDVVDGFLTDSPSLNESINILDNIITQNT